MRFFALMENPYSESAIRCEPHAVWVPFHLPIKARYNDYGSIEELEESENTESFFELLRSLVQERERERADEHDFHIPREMAVTKDMPREAWLEALVWDRVRVYTPRCVFSIRLDKQFASLEEYLENMANEKPEDSLLKRFYIKNTPRKEDPSHAVTWTMIREDVWQAMLETFPEEPHHRHRALHTPSLFPTDGYGPDSSLELAIEYRRIRHGIWQLSRTWTPGHASGPQGPEWEPQAAFTERIAKIAAGQWAKWQEE